MNAHEPKYCVTLVHGTFAPDASWTQEDSVLCKVLSEALDGDVRFSRINWGGRNSQRARLAGGRQLREQLLANQRQYPAAAQFIIAHSHGGNVGLAALQSPDVASHVRGLVCLATPFLHCRRRRYRWILTLLGLGILSAIGLFTAGLIADRPLAQEEEESLQTYLLALFEQLGGGSMSWQPMLIGGAILGCLLPVVHAGVSLLTKRIDGLQAQAQGQYPMPRQIPSRILSVSLPFDEARLGLRGLWRLTSLPSWIGHPIFISCLITLGMFSQVTYCSNTLQAAGLDAFSSGWVWVWLWTLILVSTGMLVVMLALQAIMFLVGCIHSLGYDLGGWTSAWFCDVYAQETPEWLKEQHRMFHVPAGQVKREVKRWAWRHSVVYDSPTVILGLAQWIQQQTAASQAR